MQHIQNATIEFGFLTWHMDQFKAYSSACIQARNNRCLSSVMSQILMYAKMDTSHGNDIKPPSKKKKKKDTTCNHHKRVNKREKEMGVGRYTQYYKC
ncbi:hypothetical protein HYC85_028706 [Camellia sinensis]|uniref:Uncharacterized protein n=1 Tax=Camellia sinensis TaxID=4442 RepID=A0A7J7FVZ9_CAMSI|nr:hypothetical protein HYC85_028706 [Camellia sinensis]